MHTFTRLLQLASLAALTSHPLAATPVPIGDFSFEGNALTLDSYDNNLGPEWTGTNGPSGGNAFEEYFPAFASNGTDHLGMELGYDVWQDLAVTYQANTRYTLTLAVGHRNYYTISGDQSQYLLADSTGVVRASGVYNAFASVPVDTFADAPPLIFETPNDPAAVGKTIRILLRARGADRSHFDNIRLDASSLTPLGAASISLTPATAISAVSATLSGQISAIGNAAPVVTIFWGTTQGGTNPANWQRSVTLSGTQAGTFSTAVGGLTSNTIYYFVARATNSGGSSWASVQSFATLPLPATVVTGVATQIGSTSATLGANVTATGGEPPATTIYYGTVDGGTTPANWASSISLGILNGAGTGQVSGLGSGSLYRFRAFSQNSGGSSWATNTSSFSTLTIAAAQVANIAPTGITGTTATLRGEVTNDGNDTPNITIFYGTADGGTNPSTWAQSAAVGFDSGDFTRFIFGLTPNTAYFFRCRAVNAGGTSWAPTSTTFSSTALVDTTPVIHEIHYHAADDPLLGPIPLEFIELHNPGDTVVNLSSWKLDNAVTYTFPAGTMLNPGGYVVVAQNPASLLSKYSVTALGPWIGKLSNSGETIELRDAANAIKDTVSYQAGFPWPTSADGAGPSIELLHPALDNELGGSWRASSGAGRPAATYVSPSAVGWKYAKGTAEASSPVGAWRNLTFNDTLWLTGQAPIGYGTTVACNTNLSDMAGDTASNYSTVYARKPFTIAAGQVPDSLTLKIRHDDGCIVWINGTEVYRASMPLGQVAFDGLATAYISIATWTTINLTAASTYLRGGSNVITLQGANVQKSGSSDFNLDAELSTPAIGAIAAMPTPGAANASKKAWSLIAPQSRQVTHTPSQPTANVPVTITARITDPDGMGAVTVAYQTVDPGSYIRLTDPAYLTSWTSVSMFDNGTNGDVVAGDSTFTAILPASIQTNRRLVRYKVTFADSLGNSQTVPYTDDEQPNFGYFVYNGVPAWTGTVRPGAPAVTYSAANLNTIQPYQLIANAADVNKSQYEGSFDEKIFEGTIVYDGTVYDHVRFKNRGIGSTYQSGKNKWNIFFNRSRDLVARDNWGKKYAETWNNLLLNANASPWVPAHRGSAGIEEASSARIYELAGNTNFRTHYVHWRVIDDAAEASPTDQYTGDLWGLYLAIEPTEGNFLNERGLPDGNIYDLEYGDGDKKHQGEGQPIDSSDWNTFRDSLAIPQTEAWYRTHVDLDKLYTFLAINRLIGNVDVRPETNYRYYHRSSDNKWEILGYDFDMMYIAAHHWGGTIDGVVVAGQPSSIISIMRHSALAREYRNRCRELMDLLASDPGANGGQVGQLLNEYAAMIHPPGQTTTWANLDAAMWNLNPKTAADHRGNFFKAYMTDSRGGLSGTVGSRWRRDLVDSDGDGFSDFPNRIQWFVNFATDTYPSNAAPWVRKATNTAGGGNDFVVDRQKGYGYKYLQWESFYGGYANANVEPTTAANTDFPGKPTLTATGNPAFPTSGLTFSSSAFSDPQGAATFAAWQWRIAEISAPGIPNYVAGKTNKYEVETLASSAELTTAPGSFVIPLGVTAAGKSYRVRVRHKDTTGNWGHWSNPLQFAATAPVLQLVHYWNFNTAATQLTPTQTIGGGLISTTLTSTAAVASDVANSFAAVNARNGDLAGSHLRLNNPLGATLNLAMPTVGYENLMVQYETRRSAQGAATQTVSYTLNGTTFIVYGTFTIIDGTPDVKILDFREIPAADNNPNFALRITFQQASGGVGGNNRIDNLTVEGEALPPSYNTWKFSAFPNAADRANAMISGANANPSGDGVSNLIRYALGVGPYAPVTSLLPSLLASNGRFDFRFRYDATKPNLIWRVKATNNLSTWSSVLFDSRTSAIPPLVNGWLPVTVPTSLGTGPATDPKIFMRLELELVSP